MNKEQIWGEILDLLEFRNGPESMALRENMKMAGKLFSTDIDELRQEDPNFDSVRAEMIISRCCLIMQIGPSADEGRPISEILALMAIRARELEKLARAIDVLSEMMGD